MQSPREWLLLYTNDLYCALQRFRKSNCADKPPGNMAMDCGKREIRDVIYIPLIRLLMFDSNSVKEPRALGGPCQKNSNELINLALPRSVVFNTPIFWTLLLNNILGEWYGKM